ncbi:MULTISPECIES: NAD(P)/FAD-dependent oxidoreductase [Clavibacter]|uniref:Amine oxidase n=2 Tax=Clavibacter TaxID=1573 RepID=A0A399NPQ2_9MICO|nr:MULTISPECIES: FAD-dependent oxidoreductase [Clavibacter]KDP92620.1 hypothetical protein W824_01255 [Clavibacter cf. michiganensis LMG 26808]RII96133.1 amine oxidase [Clavibacter michiganensis]UKF25302.1 FAD-dependent oxidoreductase [Clavibacter sp. A6099]
MTDALPRLAIIGAGISGIAAAYEARHRARIVMYEAADQPGGHACSIDVDHGIGLDTGFVVFNRPNYPRLSAFFAELGVETTPHTGEFTFFDHVGGRVYGSPELESETEPEDPELALIWRESERFGREGRRDFLRGQADMPLREYLDTHGYARSFQDGYIVRLSTAVWSAPFDLIWDMPAATVIAYFLAHGNSSLGGRGVGWETVTGGSRRYVDAAIAAIRPDLRLATPVSAVAEDADGVTVTTAAGDVERFDAVVVATHGDTARGILATPTDGQRQALADIRYSTSRMVLHTDTSVLPADRARWTSWNYGDAEGADGPVPYVAWYLNKLQGFESATDYVVTLDYAGEIGPEHVIADHRVQHPIIDLPLRQLQKEIHRLTTSDRVALAGSYFHSSDLGWDVIGSHEAGFTSGTRAARTLLAARTAAAPAAAPSDAVPA